MDILKTIKGITADSRKVRQGFLFAALKGTNTNGADFIDDAVSKGAIAVLSDKDSNVPNGVRLIESSDVRADLSHLACEFYKGLQPQIMVGVTGTNGKTSVVQFARQLWSMEGESAAALGTLDGGMTTPDPVALHEKLSELAKSGVTHCAIEASSHGLDQKRMDSVKLSAAGFTNLSRDHMDYHKDVNSYFSAKARLFKLVLPKDGFAIINLDSDDGKKLANSIDNKIIGYGKFKDADLRIISVSPVENGQLAVLNIFGQKVSIFLPLIGEFQLYNALCALGLVASEYINDTARIIKLARLMENLEGVAGRMQSVCSKSVYIDYAHTPDGLRNALMALRLHTKNKIICVFGCGGDRDTGKRRQMGVIAAELCDVAIVSDDNPRSEDPATIRSAILDGVPKAIEIGDRAKAISKSIEMMEKGDSVLIAGKGHESGQEINGKIYPFNDLEQAKKAIGERK